MVDDHLTPNQKNPQKPVDENESTSSPPFTNDQVNLWNELIKTNITTLQPNQTKSDSSKCTIVNIHVGSQFAHYQIHNPF